MLLVPYMWASMMFLPTLDPWLGKIKLMCGIIEHGIH